MTVDSMIQNKETNLAIASPRLDYAEATHQRQGSTDLMRIYLQDIGRIPLLKKDEEVQLAQKVQSYLALVAIFEAAAEDNLALARYQEELEIHDELFRNTGYRPSYKSWARASQKSIEALKQILTEGKQEWAKLAGLSAAEFEEQHKVGVEAKALMLKANLRLVVSVAKKYQNRGLELLDLIQEGTLGLERAVEKFDPTKGYRFSTYSYWWIRQGITRAIATQSRIIRLPVHVTEKLNKIKQAQRKLSQEKGRVAKVDEIAAELEMTSEQVREMLNQIPRSVSLELKVGRDKDTELLDLLETNAQSPEDYLIKESLQKDVKEILLDLTNREQEVIALRYGFRDGISRSLSEIGRILSLSRERVRQIEAKALQKLRHPCRQDRIRDYYENLS